MDYKEIFDKTEARQYQVVHDYLIENADNKPEGIDEMLLAVGTACYSADVRKNFKALLTKMGGEPVKAALKLISKRDYNAGTGKKNLLADLPGLEKVDGFNAPVFAKYVAIVAMSLNEGRDYFLEHGTDAEIKYYLVNELYDRNDKSSLDMFIGQMLSPRVAQLMWDVVPELAPLIRRITCRTDGKLSFGFESIDMPQIYHITLDADIDEFPSFLFGWPSLKEITITCNAKVLPKGISNLVNLEGLGLYMPIAEIPEEVFTLKALQSFGVGNTALTEIPEAIGQLENLTYLSIYNSPGVKTLPESVFALPKLSDSYKEDFRAEYMPSNEYQKVYNEMNFYIRDFEDIPIVKELLEKYKAGEEPNFFPELLMAASKCYYDDEHGRALVNLYKDVEKDAPEKLKEVNKALKSFKYVDETTTPEDYEKMRKKLQPFEWFDTEKFIGLCELMAAKVYEEYPFAKW